MAASSLSSPVRFEQASLDLGGYWGPVASSIDWCERNYVMSYYVGEWWNAWSSLAITAIAAVGFIESYKNRNGRRFLYIWPLLMLVGVGSFLFHGTLTYAGQLMDELPMMWCLGLWIYINVFMEAPHKSRRVRRMRICVAVVLFVYLLAATIVHSLYAFTTVFQLHFALQIACCLIYVVRHRLVYEKTCPDVGRLQRWYFYSLLAAAAVWVLDQQLCSTLHSLPLGFPNPQLHAVWHVLIGYNCYVGLAFARLVRYLYLTRGSKCAVRWWCWVLPRVSDSVGDCNDIVVDEEDTTLKHVHECTLGRPSLSSSTPYTAPTHSVSPGPASKGA